MSEMQILVEKNIKTDKIKHITFLGQGIDAVELLWDPLSLQRGEKMYVCNYS